jgi:SNF2 family DNA or RNA helicase
VRLAWRAEFERLPLDVTLALSLVEQIPGCKVGTKWADIPLTAAMLPEVEQLFDLCDVPQPDPTTGYDKLEIWQPKRPPFTHQWDIATQIVLQAGSLLADQMGLGKSTSAIIAAQSVRLSRTRVRPGLIVAPLFTRSVWQRELVACGAIREDLGDFCAVISRDFNDDSFKRDDIAWYFVHYDVVYYWWSKIAGLGRNKPNVAIVDEAHWIKNARSQRGRGTLVAAGSADFRILLTGTPIDNKPIDLWHILTIATGMHSWGSPLAFRQRYCGAVHNGYGWEDTGPTHVAELRARMQPYYFRRTVQDVGVDLPDLTRKTLPAELGAYRSEHDAVLNKTGVEILVRAILQGAVQHVLPELTRLRQITSRAKILATVEYVENVLVQGESVVVFAWEREVVAELARRLGRDSTLTVTGDDSEAVRAGTIALFQKGLEPRALIATAGAIREGVTLHHARFVVLHDLHWQLTHMLQMEARIYRIGQHRACQAIWVVAEGSIDTILASVLLTKSETLTTILGDTTAAQAALDVDLEKIAGRETVEAQVAAALQIWEASA